MSPGNAIVALAYPNGDPSEYLTASQGKLVKLVDTITFEQGARLGYLGIGFSALRIEIARSRARRLCGLGGSHDGRPGASSGRGVSATTCCARTIRKWRVSSVAT